MRVLDGRDPQAAHRATLAAVRAALRQATRRRHMVLALAVVAAAVVLLGAGIALGAVG